jgi:hypothetical protein
MISNRTEGFAHYAGLVESWAANRRRVATSGEPDTAGPVWEIPGIGYLLTAAIADGDTARADALWKALDKADQVDLLWVLAAQLQCALRTAFSVAGGDDDRYALAYVLAGMNVEAGTACRTRFAEMCRDGVLSEQLRGRG